MKDICESSENITVDNHIGTWYVIDTEEYPLLDEYGNEISTQTVFLLEHEEYGDEAANVIVNSNGDVILEDVWNGFDDLKEAAECEGFDNVYSYINEHSEQNPIADYCKSVSNSEPDLGDEQEK